MEETEGSDLTKYLVKQTVTKKAPVKKAKKAKVRKPRIKLWGNVLDKALKEMDMPDIELAELVGTNAGHICRIKSNKTSSISLPMAIKIAKVIKKPVEELWLLEDPNPAPVKTKSK